MSALAEKIDRLELQILETIDDLAILEYTGGRGIWKLRDELSRSREELELIKKQFELECLNAMRRRKRLRLFINDLHTNE